MDPAGLTAVQSGSLRLERLTKRYAAATVVAEVSVAIPSGQFFSLLGPSGSGKTTTLSMIAGFVDPDEGRILIEDRDVTRLSPQYRELGMVFQNYALFPHLSVAENIAFPLRVRRFGNAEREERVTWALDVVRLAGFERRLPRELSGGQQQRVALARAVVFQPPVVLMDEPLGALDKNLRYQMQVEIKEIQRRLGMTVVYVTHDQEEAMNMSDVIAIMNHGRIEQMGAPTDVYERPGSIFAGKFLGEANLIEGRIDNLRSKSLAVAGGTILRASRAIVDEEIAEGAKHFVRPERIAVHAANDATGEAGSNRVAGKVARLSFLGNLVRYGVDIGAGELVTVDAQNSGRTPAFGVGDAVTAAWRPDDAILYHHG